MVFLILISGRTQEGIDAQHWSLGGKRMTTPLPELIGNPATLVAILIAAHRSSDQDLERVVKEQLLRKHGIRVRFCRDDEDVIGGVK